MAKKTIAADELIFLFTEELRALLGKRPAPSVAIVPNASDGWRVVTSSKEVRAYPEMVGIIAQVETVLRRRFNLKET